MKAGHVTLDPEHVALVNEAIGFCQLGSAAHAWDLLETLPPEKRGHHQVLMARLMIGTTLKRWALVEDLAALFADGWTDDQRRLAGHFYREKARALIASGEIHEAGRCVQAMSKVLARGKALSAR